MCPANHFHLPSACLGLWILLGRRAPISVVTHDSGNNKCLHSAALRAQAPRPKHSVGYETTNALRLNQHFRTSLFISCLPNRACKTFCNSSRTVSDNRDKGISLFKSNSTVSWFIENKEKISLRKLKMKLPLAVRAGPAWPWSFQTYRHNRPIPMQPDSHSPHFWRDWDLPYCLERLVPNLTLHLPNLSLPGWPFLWKSRNH